MIFPESKEKSSIIGSAIGKLFSLVKRSGSDHSKLMVPSSSLMRTKCMEIHLKPTRDILLSGTFKGKFNIQDATDGCINLFQCAYLQYVEHYGGEQKWIVKEIRDVG